VTAVSNKGPEHARMFWNILEQLGDSVGSFNSYLVEDVVNCFRIHFQDTAHGGCDHTSSGEALLVDRDRVVVELQQ